MDNLWIILGTGIHRIYQQNIAKTFCNYPLTLSNSSFWMTNLNLAPSWVLAVEHERPAARAHVHDHVDGLRAAGGVRRGVKEGVHGTEHTDELEVLGGEANLS